MNHTEPPLTLGRLTPHSGKAMLAHVLSHSADRLPHRDTFCENKLHLRQQGNRADRRCRIGIYARLPFFDRTLKYEY